MRNECLTASNAQPCQQRRLDAEEAERLSGARNAHVGLTTVDCRCAIADNRCKNPPVLVHESRVQMRHRLMQFGSAAEAIFLSKLILLTKHGDPSRESHSLDCEGCVLRRFRSRELQFLHIGTERRCRLCTNQSSASRSAQCVRRGAAPKCLMTPLWERGSSSTGS